MMSKEHGLYGILPAPFPKADGVVSLLHVWHERAKGRRALMEMGAERLDDIGVDREAALAEAKKPFWRA